MCSRKVARPGALVSGIAFVSLLTMLAACGGSNSPTRANATPSIAGTWSGSFADTLLGPNSTTWVIQQSGNTVSATFTVQAPAALGRGTIQGTLTGATLAFTGAIPAGGYPAPFQNCAQTASGSIQLSGSRLTGPYSLQLGPGCSPPNVATAGTLTLTKQ